MQQALHPYSTGTYSTTGLIIVLHTLNFVFFFHNSLDVSIQCKATVAVFKLAIRHELLYLYEFDWSLKIPVI